MRRAKGFTIIELLIAGAILVVLLAALGRVYVGSMRAYRTNEAVSTERQNLQAVTELLQYEIGLAGYRCADSVSAALNRVFSGPPLTASDGASGGPDTITIRYYEDRYASGSCDAATVTYFVQDSVLFREVSGSAAEPAVEGVADLQVISWLNGANSAFYVPTTSANLGRPDAPDLAGISLSLGLLRDDGTTREHIVTIGLKNPQCQNAADCL